MDAEFAQEARAGEERAIYEGQKRQATHEKGRAVPPTAGRLDDQPVNESHGEEPWNEADVFDRIPCPESAPSLSLVSPESAHDQAQAQNGERNQSPGPNNGDPTLRVPVQQGSYGKGKRYGQGAETHEDRRRV